MHTKRVLSALLLTGIAIASVPAIITSTEQVAVSKGKQSSLWDILSSIFKTRRRSGGTRGNVCLVTPGLGGERDLWSDRPLFLWEGGVGRIQVRSMSSRNLLWNQPVARMSGSALYRGQPLQPGQTYEVRFFDREGKQSLVEFALVDARRRDSIRRDLIARENHLKSPRVTSETVAVEKAIYLSNARLWSDAFQVLHSVPNPSPNLRNFIQNTYTETCGQ